MTASRESTLGQLLGLVRQHLYVPDGKPPAGWPIGRCGSIIKALMDQGYSASEIGAAIEGVATMRDAGELQTMDGYWLKPGEKATMRALYVTRHGVRPLFQVARDIIWRRDAGRSATVACKQTEEPTRVSDVIAQVLDRIGRNKA